jgi:DNA primase
VILMRLYSEEVIKEVQIRTDIVEIISGYVSLNKRGENYVGLCPFHSEKTPSLNVNPDKQLFYCFGCGIGGNIFTFLMKKENITFPESVRWLADRYQIKLPENKLEKAMTQQFKERRELQSVNRQAAVFYKHNLLNTSEGKRALSYLKNRGISDDTIDKFYLGYAPKRWNAFEDFARKKGINVAVMEKAGLIIRRKDKKGYYDRFRDRIIFPIQDTAKNVIGFGGRVIEDGEPKYLNSPENPVFTKGSNLYALPMIKKDRNLEVIVVEGYMDCISLHQHGFTQAVATLGTALTQNQAILLKRFTDGVMLAYDADQAGEMAAQRAMDVLAGEGLKIKILRFPTGKDPDEFLRTHGRDAFEKLVSNALDNISFKLESAKKGLDVETPDGKLKFLSRAVDVLSEIESHVETDIFIKKIASEYGLSEAAIRAELRRKPFPDNGFKYKKRETRNNNKEFGRLLPVTGFNKAERSILKVFFEDENIREIVLNDLEPKHFINRSNRNIAQAAFDIVKRGGTISVTEIFNYLDEESSRELSKIMMTDMQIHDEIMLNSLISKIKEGYVKHAIEQVRKQIKKAEAVGRREELLNLLNTYQTLKAEMENMKINYTPGKGGA